MAEETDETRMAGEKLAEFKTYLDGFDRTAYGAGSSKGRDRYSALDVNMNIKKGKELGLSKDDIGRSIQGYYNTLDDDVRHGGATQRAMEKVLGMIGSGAVKEETPADPEPDPKPDPEPDPKPDPTPTPAPQNPTYGDVTIGDSKPIQSITPGYSPYNPEDRQMGQYVNQDNDINSVVQGSGNTVTNTQDNSVNQYAGDSQLFTNDYLKRFMNRVGA